MIQRRVDINFTQCIWMMHLGHLGPLEMINSSLFHWLCALLLIVWTYFSGIVFEGGLWHFLPEIPHHLPLTIILGRDLTFGDLIPLIDAPPYAVELGERNALLTHSAAQRLRNYLDFLGDTAATKPPLFCHRYILSVIVVWWHRICAGVDIWGQFCTCRSADFTCIMFTSLYRLIRWESDPADLKNGFSTKF